ncbi:hypothetical protein KKG41_06100 [Patescibacteria group bacterium]|nr:hypothetical protein [Patescibacteria group bacterium]MBU1891068.1 hypothetical protein [Patescibacteria group bacterium]
MSSEQVTQDEVHYALLCRLSRGPLHWSSNGGGGDQTAKVSIGLCGELVDVTLTRSGRCTRTVDGSTLATIDPDKIVNPFDHCMQPGC